MRSKFRVKSGPACSYKKSLFKFAGQCQSHLYVKSICSRVGIGCKTSPVMQMTAKYSRQRTTAGLVKHEMLYFWLSCHFT